MSMLLITLYLVDVFSPGNLLELSLFDMIFCTKLHVTSISYVLAKPFSATTQCSSSHLI